jgi:hypothetical protein
MPPWALGNVDDQCHTRHSFAGPSFEHITLDLVSPQKPSPTSWDISLSFCQVHLVTTATVSINLLILASILGFPSPELQHLIHSQPEKQQNQT